MQLHIATVTEPDKGRNCDEQCRALEFYTVRSDKNSQTIYKDISTPSSDCRVEGEGFSHTSLNEYQAARGQSRKIIFHRHCQAKNTPQYTK